LHCRGDAKTPVPLGVPSFQLTLVSSQRDSQSVVILRLSHANYDGVSMPVLYNDIAAAYMSKPATATSNFSSYMQHRLSQQTAPAFDFWREFLRDASMTRLSVPSHLHLLESPSQRSSKQPGPSSSLVSHLPKTSFLDK
jgi:hypothetical protein